MEKGDNKQTAEPEAEHEVEPEIEETDSRADLEEYLEYSKARSPLMDRVFYEMSQNLFDRSKIRMISRLNPLLIEDIFRVSLVSELFVKRYMNPKSPLYNHMDRMISILEELTISKDGQSRTEITNLFSGYNLMSMLESAKKKGLSGK